MGKEEKVTEKYQLEINEISYKLDQLEKGNIYELRTATGYGSLATNIIQLRKELNELLRKIDNDLPSASDKLNDIYK